MRFLFGLLFALPLLAQTNASIFYTPTTPSGSCTARASLRLKTPTGLLYSCQSGTWTQITSSGGPPTGTAGGDLTGTYPNPTLLHPSVTVDGHTCTLGSTCTGQLQFSAPASDILCAKAADTSNSLTCNNLVTDDLAFQTFATTYTIPANFWHAGAVLDVCVSLAYWATSSTPNIVMGLFVNAGATQVYGPNASMTFRGAQSNQSMELCWHMKSTDTGANVYTFPYGFIPDTNAAPGGIGWANNIAQPVNVGAGSQVLSFKFNWNSSTGLSTGTYTSGISATGTVGQTCNLTLFNNGNSGGTATVALTGTNTIAGGTALVITNTGSASTSAATSATAGNGTATCSGTATVATVLGGAQGNQVRFQTLTVTQLN